MAKNTEGLIPFKKGKDDRRNVSGRPLSAKTEIKKIYQDNDSIVWTTKEPLTRTKTDKDGNTIKQYGLQLTRMEAVVAKLDRLIMKAKDSVSLGAIKFLFKDIIMDPPIKNQTNIQNNIETNSIEMPEVTDEVTYTIKFT